MLIYCFQASDACAPIVYNRDLYVNVSIAGTPLNSSGIANPCGIIAYTVFNDSYTLYTQNNASTYSILDYGIAWPSDIQSFKITDPTQMWYNVTS